MTRRTFDTLASAGGVIITIVLLVAGTLLFVGYDFANDNVQTQLAEQKIFFPKADTESMKDPRVEPYLKRYAGLQLTTGAQAEAYANHFIAVHIADTGKGTLYEGKTYAEMGAMVRANPNDTEMAKARDTIFKGETLRGLLLNAYAWWKMGQIAKLGSILAFVLAVVMGLFTVIGFVHRRRVSPTEEFLAPVSKMRAAS